MIKGFRYIGSVSCFDTFRGTTNTEFAPLTLVYAENGRGKTTLVALLRSVADNNPKCITSRHRLGAHHDPHVVIELDDGTTPVFQNGTWSANYEPVLIFDDHFVDDNVYSGLTIGPDHRQNLLEVILGSQGVSLKQRVDEITDKITQLNQKLREKQTAIPNEVLHGLDINSFCDLPALENPDERITEIGKQLLALKQADQVRSTRSFSRIDFPSIDADAIQILLDRQLQDLDNAAVASVQKHLAHIGAEAEQWVANGVSRIIQSQSASIEEQCPFCGQVISGIQLVDEYRAFFGEAYRQLQDQIYTAIETYKVSLSGDALANFQRQISQQIKQYEFWRNLVSLPDFHVDIDTLAI